MIWNCTELYGSLYLIFVHINTLHALHYSVPDYM